MIMLEKGQCAVTLYTTFSETCEVMVRMFLFLLIFFFGGEGVYTQFISETYMV